MKKGSIINTRDDITAILFIKVKPEDILVVIFQLQSLMPMFDTEDTAHQPPQVYLGGGGGVMDNKNPKHEFDKMLANIRGLGI